MTIDKLPLWKGVVSRPQEELFLLPFSLEVKKYGYLAQEENEDRQRVIESYSKESYSFITTLPGASNWGDVIADSRYNFIKSHMVKDGPLKIMDIGAGNFFIPDLICSNYDVAEYRIVDPSMDEIVKGPIQISRIYLGPEKPTLTGYDYVISLSCIEHVSDPYSFLVHAREAVRENDGKIIMVFPDTENPLAMGDFNVILHEHLNYFTPDTFTNLANAAGLEVEVLESVNNCLFTVLKVRKQDPAFTPKAVQMPEPEKFSKNLQYFEELLAGRLGKGEKVALHGACNGLNNLLAISSGWQKYRDQLYIFDGDDRKTGQYLPAYKDKPILSSQDSIYREMDSVVVAAMSFFGPITDFLMNHHGIAKESILPVYP